jgi:Na+/H+ antiporter NhaA
VVVLGDRVGILLGSALSAICGFMLLKFFDPATKGSAC